MFCPKCGKYLPDGARFCDGCGVGLAAPARPVQGNYGRQAPPVPPQPPEPPEKEKKKKKWWIPVIIIVAVLLLLGGLALVGWSFYNSTTSSGVLVELTLDSDDDLSFTLEAGDSRRLTLAFEPEDWDGEVTYTSSHPDYAEVSDNGKVTNVNTTDKEQRVVITITAGGQTGKCVVYCQGVSAPESAAPAPTATPAPVESSPVHTGEKAPGDYTGEVHLYSTMTDSDLEAMITCFNKKYPNINVIVIRGSAGELTTRIDGEKGNPYGDVMWGGLADSDGDAYAEIFEAWVSEYDAENLEGYTSPNGLYSMDHLSTVVFVVNEDLEAELGLNIQSYEDLLDPALKGKIITADPNSSSSAWNNLSNIMAVYGTDSDAAWSYIEQLMPNLVISASSSGVFKNTQAGEYVVGLTYEDGAVNLLRDGATNIRLQYPTNGTSAAAFGTALIKGGPNQENAKLMIDFICSAEGQTAMAAYQEGTLRYTNANYEMPINSWLVPSSDIRWVTRDVEYLTANKSAILDHWNALWATTVG